jgi:hypothetical protein
MAEYGSYQRLLDLGQFQGNRVRSCRTLYRRETESLPLDLEAVYGPRPAGCHRGRILGDDGMGGQHTILEIS